MPATDLLLGWTAAADADTTVGFGPLRPPRPSRRPHYADTEGHLVTIAPTGAGKGRAAIIPALLDYEGPAIVIDPKGEAFAVTARQRALLGPVVCLDPYRRATTTPDALNPFDLVALAGMDPPEAALLIADLLAPPSFPSDPFWDHRSVSLYAGLIAALLTTETPEHHTIGNIRAWLTDDDPVYRLAVLMDTKGKLLGNFARQEIAQFLQLPEERTRPSVLATATQHLTLFGDEAVAQAVGTTTFDLDAVRRGDPMTLYLVLPVEKLRSHARLLRLWTATLLRVLMARTCRPATPTLLLLDEAAQLGPLDDLVTATTLLRGYGVRVWSFWQNLQQLQRLYPADWETLLTNARTLQIFGTHWLFRQALAPLLDTTPDTLSLDPDEQLLVSAEGLTTRARKADYLADPQFAGRFDPNPMFVGTATTAPARTSTRGTQCSPAASSP